MKTLRYCHPMLGRGVVVTVVRRMNEVTLRRVRLVLRCVIVFGQVYYHSTYNQPTRSTQPCIAPGSLNRVGLPGWGKGWNVTSAGWQVTLCDPIWHVSSSSDVASSTSDLLYLCYFVILCLGFTYLKPNSITLASSELAPNMFGASSELVRS